MKLSLTLKTAFLLVGTAAASLLSPDGRSNYVSFGLNAKRRMVMTVVQVVTSNSKIFNALGSEPSVASAVGQDAAERVMRLCGGFWPASTYSFWGESKAFHFVIVTKMSWEGEQNQNSIIYDTTWGVARNLAAQLGLRAIDDFVPDTGVPVSKRDTGGIMILDRDDHIGERNSGICPGPRKNNEFTNNNDLGVTFGASCDSNRKDVCWLLGLC